MQNSTNNEYKGVTNGENQDLFLNDSPLTGVFKVIGGKWKIMLIKAIAAQCPKRFGELKREMNFLSQGTLTTQLKEMERDGLILREAFAESPPRVEYKLTSVGKTLLPVIDVLEDWWTAFQNNNRSEEAHLK
ncbi:DNA-binding HxlR family transcriptional regulator [Pedobacter sp. W3I1]|uniref:winged helix-turn-helix transcriptional regulator n=1 Tax=Pedobacter sp. W3I1 TaxID=3042291 RepID=UPI0027866D4F|nr:helix-turn-helix domain-containing protein [Pedobacter sp. W3I1]MDQ0640729.1 DNA-binding HxlR family transcriptional regulator [Pedobacter sp. W3I1]